MVPILAVEPTLLAPSPSPCPPRPNLAYIPSCRRNTEHDPPILARPDLDQHQFPRSALPALLRHLPSDPSLALSFAHTPHYRRNTEHDPPYWRGQIWINVNFLALRSLHYYAALPGPHAARASEAYQRLRHALVSNLVQQYRRTGYLWEQYDDVTGSGLSSHPFTGWTALLTLAAAESF